ncbi:MAG: RDD family protein [Flavobacteriaceae bacterium]
MSDGIATQNIATAGLRIAGGLVDLVFALAIFFMFSVAFGTVSQTDEADFNVNLTGWPFFAYALLMLLIYSWLEFRFGKTPGKFMVRTRVVKESGAPITFNQALIRNALRIIDGLLLYLVGLIIVLATKERQRFGDIVAKTLVVHDPVVPMVSAA